MESTTVRIPVSTKQMLDEMARKDRLTLQGELVKIVEEAQRHRILAETRAAYAAMPEETWASLEKDRELWDNTLSDGLENH